jgi:hypothetical protein
VAVTDATATPYSEEGRLVIRWPTPPRFNAKPAGLVGSDHLSVQKASSTSHPRRLNHTQLLITFAYHRVRKILLRLRANADDFETKTQDKGCCSHRVDQARLAARPPGTASPAHARISHVRSA